MEGIFKGISLDAMLLIYLRNHEQKSNGQARRYKVHVFVYV